MKCAGKHTDKLFFPQSCEEYSTNLSTAMQPGNPVAEYVMICTGSRSACGYNPYKVGCNRRWQLATTCPMLIISLWSHLWPSFNTDLLNLGLSPNLSL